jgi:hypothetical protein
VEGGTTARYGWVAPVPMLAKASGAWLHGLIDLGILATNKYLLIILNFTQNVSTSEEEK